MSDLTTKVMLEGYIQKAMPTMFLSGMFKPTFHNSQEIEIDIMRSDEDVSIAIQDLSTGARLNTVDDFTNKFFKPTLHREAVTISSDSLIQRSFGENPFASVDFAANTLKRALNAGQKLAPKIQRAIELQSSQVLQTGAVTLVDENGASMYSINYNPKASHFPQVTTSWSAGGSTPIADLNSLAEVIRGDGLSNPDTLIMGSSAFENFLSNTTVKDRFDNRRLDLGFISQEFVGNGGTRQGTISIGDYRFEIWTYNGRYKDPQTGNSTKFIDDNKVVMLSSGARFDAAFGRIPRFSNIVDPRVPRELLTRVSSETSMIDMQHWAWFNQDATGLTIEVGTRPLMKPTAIDTYGCLNTVAP
jgi:hypothetical protein